MTSNSMRVAVWFNLPSGGARRVLAYQIRGLLRQGHHVETWSAPLKDPQHHVLPEGVIQHVHPLDDRHSPDTFRPPAAKTPWRRVSDFARYTQTWLQIHDQFARECATEINQGGFDVLLAHNCWRMHSPFIGRYVNAPKVLYLHEPKRALYEAISGSAWLPYRVKQREAGRVPNPRGALKDHFDTYGQRQRVAAELDNARSFDRILVNSHFSKESVLRAYGLEARVCRLGIDTELFHPVPGPKEPIIVSVGHVGRIKNTHFLIEAASKIGPKKPTVVLATHWIDENYQKECDALASKLGVEVIYREQVDDAALVNILSRSSVLGFAAYLEPFGLAPLEANACGTAAVAVAEGGPRESIVDGVNGFLVERNPAEMADRMNRLISDSDYAEFLGRKARDHVQEEWNLSVAEARLEAQLLAIVTSA